jgi:hypothetical protein
VLGRAKLADWHAAGVVGVFHQEPAAGLLIPR